jgi:flagellar motor switch protein FliG
MPATSTALRKAAILISSLDAATADALLEQFPDAQADLLRRTVAAMAHVDADEQDRIIGEFLGVHPHEPAVAPEASEQGPPGIELDSGLARRLGLDPARPLDHDSPLTPAGARPFRFLDQHSGDHLAALLSSEHPQTVALVVSHLPAERAAEVLAELPEAVQADVLGRLVDLDEAHPDIVREVERGLESRMTIHTRRTRRQTQRLSVVSEILRAADPIVERDLLGNLARHDAHLAARLHRHTPAFDDLAQLSDEDLRAVLEAAGPDVALLGLAGADPHLLERVLSHLPAREARTLRHALAHLGPTRLSDLEAAQQGLVDAARRLADEGRISLPQAPPRRPLAGLQIH